MAEKELRYLFSLGVVEKGYRILREGNSLLVPLKSIPEGSFRVVESDPPRRMLVPSPVSEIVKNLARLNINPSEVPRKWIRYGDSMLLRISGEHRRIIAEEFLRFFELRAVYRITGRIEGLFRTPSVELIAGEPGDTVHLENGIYYVFDPERIMFSPGNVNERILMSKMRIENGKVLDLFAGIGYFSLPLAKYSGASRVVAYDINPEAVDYLLKSALRNGLSGKVKAAVADSFKVDPQDEFDLVVMGNFQSISLLPRAFGFVKPGGLVIIHHLVREDHLSSYREEILHILRKNGYKALMIESHRVKSFSPKVWHFSTTLRKLGH